MGISEKEEREKGTESLFKQIISENFPNLWKGLSPRIQEANGTPNCLHPKRPSLRHIILKLSKINDRESLLQAAREVVNLESNLHPINISFSSRNFTSQEREESNAQINEKRKSPAKNNPEKLLIRDKREIKVFPDMQTLREFTTPRLALQ